MGGVSRENGVLKLVYPGGSVEVHKQAITAAEVMKRNPRHCVTRPDVFKYPWIVVRPESVLSPGRVFYVVPYHTIRRLLQSNGIMAKGTTDQKKHRHPPKQDSGKGIGGLRKQTPPPPVSQTEEDKWADEVACKLHGSLSNPRQNSRRLILFYEQHDEYGCQPLNQPTQSQPRRRKPLHSYEYEEEYYERRHVNLFDNPYAASHLVMKVEKKREVPPKVLDEKKKRTRKIRSGEEPKKKYPIERWPLTKPSTKTYPIHETSIGASFVEEERVTLDTKENRIFHTTRERITNLKSCLKKKGINAPKPPGLKVTFVFPGDDD